MREHESSKKVGKISSAGTLHAHSFGMRSRRERATLLWKAPEFKVARTFLSAWPMKRFCLTGTVVSCRKSVHFSTAHHRPPPPTAMPHPPVTVVIGGTIAIDHVKTPDAEAAGLLGGSAAYAALAASFFCQPVGLVGIIGRDFPQEHLDMLENHGISLAGVERSDNESFTWSGEYHANMNERTTHHVGLNVLENWQVKVPAAAASATIVVLANMSPDNQLEMLAQCGIGDSGSRIADSGSRIADRRLRSVDSSALPSPIPDTRSTISSALPSSNPQSTIHNPQSTPTPRFVIADTMDLWIEIANERLQEVLPHLDLFVLNEGEARALAGTSNLVRAGRILLEKGPRHVVIKLGEFGAMLFSSSISSALQSSILNPQSSIASASEPAPGFFRCSAWPLESVADPTGAGDTFLGAMAGYLAVQGPPPYTASVLRQAVIQGSILASFTCEAFSTRRLESLEVTEFSHRLQQFRHATLW